MYVIRNSPDGMVDEMIDGYIGINANQFLRGENSNSIIVKNVWDRVVILAGGGAGCEPLYMGCVGEGMADAVVVGNIFAAPSATELLRTIQQIYHEKGVLMITGNYFGDVLNYGLAEELCAYEGISAKAVFVKDDILHKPLEEKEKRRGICGIIPTIKIAAGAVSEGLQLDKAAEIAQKTADNIGTVSVTFWPGYQPETGEPLYTMQRDSIEFGMGFNGEPGKMQTEWLSAERLSAQVMEYLSADMGLDSRDEIALIVNGKGATSYMELFILVHNLQKWIQNKKLHLFKAEVGNFFTAPGMGGVSVTVLKLDEELKRFYNKRSSTPLYNYNVME